MELGYKYATIISDNYIEYEALDAHQHVAWTYSKNIILYDNGHVTEYTCAKYMRYVSLKAIEKISIQ